MKKILGVAIIFTTILVVLAGIIVAYGITPTVLGIAASVIIISALTGGIYLIDED